MILRARGATDVTPDTVLRIAQIQTTDERRDRRALELDVRATLDIDDRGIVLLSDATVNAEDSVLQLFFVHATDATGDRHFALQPCGAHRWCTSDATPKARGHFELRSADDSWRIAGVRELGRDHIILLPAWSNP